MGKLPGLESALVRIEGVSKHYEHGLVPALRDVSLSVAAGTVVAIMGPSGCGKTSLLNIIGTIDQPSAGELFFGGKRLQEYLSLPAFRRSWVGFVFQFHHLLPTLTLAENVELPLLPQRDLSRRKRREIAVRLLRELDLEQCADVRAARVSGGERQRAAVARALVNNPRLVLADEPTGSVDSQTAARVLNVMLEHCRQHAMTIIVATHNEAVAERADSIVRMRDGRIVSAGGV